MANQKNQTSNEGGSGNQSMTGGGRGKQSSGSPGTKSSASVTGSTPTADMTGGGDLSATSGGGQSGSLGTTGTSTSGSTGMGTSGLGSTGTGSTGMSGTSGLGSTGTSGTSGLGSTEAGTSGSMGSTGTGSGSMSTGSTSDLSTSGSGSGGTGTGTAVARSLYDQAKETAGQAYGVAAEKATSKLEEQKTTLSGGLATVADSVRRVSENLRGPDVQDGISKFTAQYSDTAARKIEDVANYFEQKSVREMYTDVERFARRNPAVFVGGAFALGLLLSRFLKSGAERSHTIGGSHSSHHDGPISTASDEGSGQGIQGISAGDTTPGASIS